MATKIDIDKVLVTPQGIREHCAVFKVTDEIEEWVEDNGLEAVKHPKGYLNIYIEGLKYRWEDIFSVKQQGYYFDGFSPNLNKELHLGHLSNLVYASTISNLCDYLTPVSILNDTDNNVNKEAYYGQYQEFCKIFNYNRYRDYFASEMNIVDGQLGEFGYVLNDKFEFHDRYLKDKEFNYYKVKDGKYLGCVAIDTPDPKILIKNDGSTTYLNQDLAFAKKLYEPIIYLTGSEQKSHFETVCKFFPNNKNLSIGLIKLDGKKMASREGNVIFLKEILKEYAVNELKDTFLNYNYSTSKNNVEIKLGLSDKFKDKSTTFENEKLYLIYLAAKSTINPSLLYNSLKKESDNDIDYGLKLLGYAAKN